MRDGSDELNNGGKYDYTTLIVSLKSSLKKLKVKINKLFHALFCLVHESSLFIKIKFDELETKFCLHNDFPALNYHVYWKIGDVSDPSHVKK